MKYKILCIGNQWRGSDDGSIFRAFSRAGHLISIMDDKLYLPSEVSSFSAKVVRRLGKYLLTKDFNESVLKEVRLFGPDMVCVYKGYSLYASTLREIRSKQIPVFCIYPDVSLFDHGGHIPACIPLYDYIFTTKSFGLADLKEHFGFTSASVIRHCADPEIHRPIDIGTFSGQQMSCDVSFIGSHSLKKEKVLEGLIKELPRIQMRVWGGSWDRRKTTLLDQTVQSSFVMGDLFAMAISASRINLGILSEVGGRASSGDLITSRTFHIPGAGGFLLHERTKEFLELFEEGIEAECYDSIEELTAKVRYYLDHAEERLRIAKAGHEKVSREHTSDNRAIEVISTLQNKGIIR